MIAQHREHAVARAQPTELTGHVLRLERPTLERQARTMPPIVEIIPEQQDQVGRLGVHHVDEVVDLLAIDEARARV
jgi:hypothetical protein